MRMPQEGRDRPERRWRWQLTAYSMRVASAQDKNPRPLAIRLLKIGGAGGALQSSEGDLTTLHASKKGC